MTRRARIVVCIAMVLLAACSTPEAQDRTPSATAACAEPEFPQLQFGSHLLGDTPPPLPYSSTPPTSGWHASGAIPITIATLSEPQQVSVLEVGAVVVSHDGLSGPDQTALEQHVTDRYSTRVAVTPYPALGQKAVVFAAWGVMQRCDALDLAALDTFVDVYAAEDPDVPGTDATPRADGTENR
ncbi:DUF3105 domain-containing protein [Euzebya rosea]|uniref:DUF3105 domain-containing protein n=1 Tax=Euzebya rosea TaxID=2052804 RepID=UPI000D3E8C3A|nr:DUF3105 domain-containing protein [Euzebya rosea]